MGNARKPPERSDAARRSIESRLLTVRMTLAPGSERDKPLESRKLNRYHRRSVVQGRAIWDLGINDNDARRRFFRCKKLVPNISCGILVSCGATKMFRARLMFPRSAALAVLALAVLRSDSAPAFGQTIYWTEAESVRKMVLPSGSTETLIERNHHPYANGIAIDSAAGHLYWTTSTLGTIERSNLDGSDVVCLVDYSGQEKPIGIALDTAGGKMYWALGYFRNTPGKIQRANLNGSEIEDVVVADVVGPSDVALDLVSGKLYWTDWSLDVIRRSNLDGKEVETLIDTDIGAPRSIALDIPNGKMYWTDFAGSLSTGKVERANLDGSDRRILANDEGVEPAGIMLDSERARILWIDDEFQQKAVRYMDLDGGNPGTLVQIASGFLWDVALDSLRDRIYWSNMGHSTIYSVTLDGSDIRNVFPTLVHAPRGLALRPGSGRIFWTDLGSIASATTIGEEFANVLEHICCPDRTFAVDPSTNRMYWFGDSGYPTLMRSRLDGTETEELLEVPFALRFPGGDGAVALDLKNNHLFLSFIQYSDELRIVRASLDGSDPTEIFVGSVRTLYLGGLAVDVIGERLYWSAYEENGGGFGHVLSRSDLDGGNVERLFGDQGAPSSEQRDGFVVVAPWERALYVNLFSSGVIQRTDLDGNLLEDVTNAFANVLTIDACETESVAERKNPAALVRCLRGPSVPLPENCACADFTSEGLVDLRDVSAFMLSYSAE